MKTITAIRAQTKGGRANLFLDGAFALSLSYKVIEEAALRVGDSLSEPQLQALAQADQFNRSLDYALNLLSYRPRSQAEMRLRLRRRGLDEEAITKLIQKLGELGLMDDAAFALFWRENRQSFRPRSRWLMAQELRQKGVDAEIVAQVVAEVDDEAACYRAGLKKARGLKEADYPSFRRRLGAYLRRRGFGYKVISPVTQRLWQERHGESS